MPKSALAAVSVSFREKRAAPAEISWSAERIFRGARSATGARRVSPLRVACRDRHRARALMLVRDLELPTVELAAIRSRRRRALFRPL
jgi:hypothetical protein